MASAAEAQTLAAGLLAEGRRPGALIVDLVDPDAGFCERLIAAEILSGVPVIAIVGSGRRGDGARFRAAGVRAYLTRPVDEERLARFDRILGE